MNSSNTTVLDTDFEQELYQLRITVNIVGTCISFLGYALMILTAIIFPSWRKHKQNQMWLHMCGTYLVFFCLDFYTFINPIQNVLTNMTVDHIKKYFVKASMCWMMAGAWLTYKNLVDVFSGAADKFMLKASLFSYVTPMFFVGTSYVLYIIQNYDHIKRANGNAVSCNCDIYIEKQYRNAIWYATCFLDDFLLVAPVYGSIILYLRVTYYFYKNRKVRGQERDLASTVALGFFFVFTCCVQCVIITAKYMFSLGGVWSYMTIYLMAFHVTTYSMLFIVCNKLTRKTWIHYLKTKLRVIKS